MLRRKLHPQKVMVIGMALLAAASVGHWYLERHSGYSESIVDFWSGLLYGAAIGTTLLGVWLHGRSRRGGD